MIIISERLNPQDVLQNKACSNCLHAVEEHDGKCYALEFDGSSYSACKCQQLSFEFKIRLKVPDININMNGN